MCIIIHRVTTSFLKCLQSRIASGGLHRGRKKYVDEEEGEEDENDPAGRWMGLGGPFFRPHRQLSHSWHRQVLRRAFRRVPARF